MATGFDALTEKEKQTLRLLLAGHDAKSMARHLELSVHTINERLRDARRKLSASSSKEAARLLREAEGADPDSAGDKQIGDAPAATGEEQSAQHGRHHALYKNLGVLFASTGALRRSACSRPAGSRSSNMLVNRRTFLSLAAAAAVTTPALASVEPAPGSIETLAKFGRDGKPEPRIRVWLPPGYSETKTPHATLYMLDGQFAFAGDSEGVNFAADRRVAGLMAAGSIKPHLIIAIDNLEEERFLQYMPQTIYDRAGAEVRATIDREISRVGNTSLTSAQFIRYLQGQLKPFIDSRYRTSPDRRDTAIFGASMAGVMAGAIFVEAQGSFGRGACMSPNWPIYDKRMIDHPQLPSLWAAYFAQLGGPADRRLWLDHGTQMMDAGMAPHQSAIAARLLELGWRRGCNLSTRVYNAGHAFAQSAVQMDEALAWLLA